MRSQGIVNDRLRQAAIRNLEGTRQAARAGGKDIVGGEKKRLRHGGNAWVDGSRNSSRSRAGIAATLVRSPRNAVT